jgi:hypothetical protein
MTKQLKGEENTSIKPQSASNRFWQLRVVTFVLICLFGLGIILLLNYKYNAGAVITAFAVLGGVYLTILRDQNERSFKEERAARADFESDRQYALLLEEQKIRKLELFLKLNPMPSDKEKEIFNDLLLPPEENGDTTK